MLNVTKLYCDEKQPADGLRYGQGHNAPRSAGKRRPIIVWNITRRCNLHCIHCYSDSEPRNYPGELTLFEMLNVVDDLAAFNVPAILLSGGEPLLHRHFFELARYITGKKVRLTISTNGNYITEDVARQLKQLGVTYVGISLDGIGATHDYFRGRQGAFDKAVDAFRNCAKVGQKSGLRLTLSQTTVRDLDQILDFIEAENIQRVCFYHLVYSGRGANLGLLEPTQIREALDKIMDRTRAWSDAGCSREVLTVDQPADGAYLYSRLLQEDPARAERAYELLSWNGGGANSSGVGIANIDPQGNVHPDQFWQSLTLGNVRNEPFSQIWKYSKNPTLNGLRNRLPLLEGRCAQCKFQAICGGGFRVRAEQAHGNPWADDPGCYLSDEEILH